MLGVVQDITERKRTEEALRASEANYREIFESANDGIFVHDLESGKILSVNQKACEMFGYTREELVKLTVGDISTDVSAYDQKHVMRWIKKTAKEGPQLLEWIGKGKSGRTFWVEVNLKLAVIEGEQRLLAIIRDISERKKTEETLHSAFEQSQVRSAETEALLEGARAVLENREFQDAARSIFDICKNITGAAAGYVALLSKDGTENEVLFLDSGGRPCTVDPELPMPIRGLREEAYRTGKAVYHVYA
jgi:PAS domain S-box-containing protein